MRLIPLLAFFATPLLVFFPACKKDPPRAGDKCQMSEEGSILACGGPDSELLCKGLKLVAIPCRGARGCTGGGPPQCDATLGKEGESCMASDFSTETERACSADHQTTLVCKMGAHGPGVFVVGRPCRGPRACGVETTGVACDQSLGQVGDVCRRIGDNLFGSCSVDRKLVLSCEDAPDTGLGPRTGKHVKARECPTPKGCDFGSTDPAYKVARCDLRGSKVGDPCGKGNEGSSVCSPDASAIYACDPKSLAFVSSLTCKKGEKCRELSGGIVLCSP